MDRECGTYVCNTTGDATLSKSDLYGIWQLLTVAKVPEESAEMAIRPDDVLRRALQFKKVAPDAQD
jgi:hypothetical protein